MSRPSSMSHPLAAGMVVVALLLLTIGAAHRIAHIAVAAPESADILQDLPVTVGDWTGEDVLFCQNEHCLRSFRVSELHGVTNCPVCGGTLDRIALGEHNILPPDTLIDRKLYTNPGGEQVYATVVLSRSEQKSIHRPQQCLPAQGFVIESTRVMAIPLPKRAPLDLTVLRAERQTGGAGARIVYAYCFAGGGRETASNTRRLLWMAWDNLVHGYRARWAYVSVQTADPGNGRTAEPRLAGFIRAVYPLIHRP